MSYTKEKTTLIEAGMDPYQAEMYLILVQNGELDVPGILEHTEVSRTTVYDALTALMADEYVLYRKEGRSALYSPAHPTKILSLLEAKRQELAVLEQTAKEHVRTLVGAYNVSMSKPGIQYFEGIDQLKDVLFDSLKSGKQIYTFINNETTAAFAKAIDEQYVQERKKRGIKKKIIMLDNATSRSYAARLHDDLTEIRFISEERYPFEGASEIYDGSISYLIATEKHISATLIKHPMIAKMHKALFEHAWDHATPFSPLADASNRSNPNTLSAQSSDAQR